MNDAVSDNVQLNESQQDDPRRDRGQAVGLIVMSLALVAMIAIGIADVAARLTQRSRAQNAADAAALAGVTGGAPAAGTVAARNGGVVVSYAEVGDDLARTVTVEVVVGEEHALARASSAP